MSEKPATARPLALAACVVAVFGVAAVWAGASALLRLPTPWMAIVAALDAVLLLRLASWPRGASRTLLAVAVTLATILVAQHFVATANIGVAMGLRPFEALPLMSMELAMLYARSNLGVADLACYAAAMAAAWWGSR